MALFEYPHFTTTVQAYCLGRRRVRKEHGAERLRLAPEIVALDRRTDARFGKLVALMHFSLDTVVLVGLVGIIGAVASVVGVTAAIEAVSGARCQPRFNTREELIGSIWRLLNRDSIYPISKSNFPFPVPQRKVGFPKGPRASVLPARAQVFMKEVFRVAL